VLDHQTEGFSTYHHWLRSQGYRPPDTARDGSRVFGRHTAARLPEAAGKPAFLAREASRFLDEHGGGPFALVVSFLEPHMPFYGPWDGRYPPAEIDLPATWYASADEGMPLRNRLRREEYALENPFVGSNDERGWRELKARYWGLASLVDEYAGRIIDHLHGLGVAEDTIVVYTSDHGDMMGEHRLVAKCVPNEGAARVPLIVLVPGDAPRRVATPVSQVSLLPTLLDALGHRVPAHAQEPSLLPLMRTGDTRPDEAEVVLEWSGTPHGETADGQRVSPDVLRALDTPLERAIRALAAQQRTIRRGRWKLTVDESAEHELYDLDADPGETDNLLAPGRPPHAPPTALAAARDLWVRVRTWQERTGDRLTLPAPVP
jgi:arylsulfatase A-like enzyme